MLQCPNGEKTRRNRIKNESSLPVRLHPRLRDWFFASFPAFTHAQLLCVPSVLKRESILLTSPTGSGKTLAGFLGVFDSLLRELDSGGLKPGVRCVYVSPLRALAYDIEKNLRAPIAGMGLEKELRIHLRTGDTTATDRTKFRNQPSPFLVTTPESLAILLAQESYAQHLAKTEFVIVDELHSFAGNKRGADLSISLERLERLVGAIDLNRPQLSGRAGGSEPDWRGEPPLPTRLVRIGLSATAAPLDLLAEFLVGKDRHCCIAEARIEKQQIVDVFSPIRRNPYPPSGYTGARLYAELSQLIRSRQSVIVFTNVRSAAEQIGLRLREHLPELADAIEIHHASLDRSVRLGVEDRLKNGELRAVVCSTSLELGIDIGAVDLVVMVATPKGVSRAIQRIGRSGHSLNKSSHGILVATNVNDLVEATVTAKLVRERALDPIKILEKPFDVVAQHIVGIVALAPASADSIYDVITRARPFHDLTREEFDRVLHYLEGGGEALAQQYRGVFGKISVGDDGIVALANKRVAREFLINIGTIVSEGFVDVMLKRRRLGSVEEGFVKGLQIGDLFVLGGRVLRLIDTGVQEAFVERADGQLPTIPRWNAAKMPLTSGVARAVRELRADLADHLRQETNDAVSVDWLVERYQISLANAQAVVEQFRTQLAISDVPTGDSMLIELYRDEDFSHYFFHALIGRSANDALSRIVAWRMKNRSGGNALVTIDDSGFLLTLRRFQELMLEDWRVCFEREGAEDDLRLALRGSELVKWQFRGVAQTGLMVPRNYPGQKRIRKQMHWSTETIFRVLEAHEPDHPLLKEAYRQASQIFLDAEEANAFLDRAQHFDWQLRELPAVSPFSFPIYASKIKETMMLEDPAVAVERIYRELYARARQVALTNENWTELAAQ
ncbi:MAG: helicase [Verrucomicrobia bacterium]|nr:MAG: helicase [Verrucomicrobiota bacterium]